MGLIIKRIYSFLKPTTPNTGWLANLRDPTTGYTVLHSASLNGHLEIVQLLVEQDEELLTTKDRRGCLPLHLAAWNGHHQVVQHLIQSDSSTVDDVNNAKEASLHLAAQHGHGRVVSILLQKQANPRLRNARFENALDIAARTGKENVCRLLICHSPELALQASFDFIDSPKMKTVLFKSAAECSRVDNKTVSQHIVYPLHVAARHGHIECLKVFCESGFDVNYVTEEGTALHVAALFGQVEAVKLLLGYGVDIRVKDSQGKTVLEKLEEHETQRATDLTQIIQSREGWSECRKLIEHYRKSPKMEINGNRMEPDEKEVVWRTLPENSLAVSNQNTNFPNRLSSTSSNGGIYYPPSMTVEHVVFDDDNHASTITLSTNPQDLNESSGGENHSNSSSISPSLASTSSHIRVMPKFPVTSPNAKTRHANTKRFGNPVLINGAEPKLVPFSSSNNEPPCNYQPPPQYETWHQKQTRGAPYDNIQLGIPNRTSNHSYRNIPQPYDNAPLGNHRKWDHACQNHGLENAHQPQNHGSGDVHQQPGFRNGTVGVGNGKNYLKSNQVIREDGTQTIPAVKLTPSRPTILNGVFAQTIQEHSERSQLPPSLPPKPRLKDSKSTEFAHPTRSSGVTFADSTLERSVSPDRFKPRDFQGKAPLALPEELGGSTCTSLVAVSVKNRKSQALTLQLSSVNPPSSMRQSNISYPSEPEDLKNMPDRPVKKPKKTDNEIEEWLHLRVGLPLARSAEISTILNRNGFDEVKFIKGTLSRQSMTEMEIDKSIQHQISVFLEGEICQVPSIEDFDYASDWLSALKLIDYLEFFSMQDLTLIKKITAANLSIVDLKLMGINLIGHLERIRKSLNPGSQSKSSSLSTLPNSGKTQSSSIHHTEETFSKNSEEKSDAGDSEIPKTPENPEKWEEKTALLLQKCASYSAHYLGSSEISNVEGAEDCRRAMNLMKSRIRQINKVPQVLLEISVDGVDVLDSTTNRLTVQHEISRIQVVCQDELDLNCFAYIFQDGEKNFCHVYCVLTAEMARDIIMTLGHAFNLAYNLAIGNTGH
ncbi:hypothetical protein FO519_000435 [Halicephalobus sp. NKZ332]|nr:hypothetical protein FO519_000435 [Halicephalobus sp. NKZ332]